MHNPELLMAEAYDEGVVSEVIRPAAIIPEESARAVLVELALRDVQNGGVWQSEPSLWSRYDRSWEGYGAPGGRRADRHHPGRLRHPDPVRDHDLPGHGHPVRHRSGLDGHVAVRRGARASATSTWPGARAPRSARPRSRSGSPSRRPGRRPSGLDDDRDGRAGLLLDGRTVDAGVRRHPDAHGVAARLGPGVGRAVGTAGRLRRRTGSRAAALGQRAGADPVAPVLGGPAEGALAVLVVHDELGRLPGLDRLRGRRPAG